MQNILDAMRDQPDKKIDVINALLEYDQTGWSPLMRVLQTDHNAKEVVLHSTYVTVKVGNLERRNQIVVTVGRRI